MKNFLKNIAMLLARIFFSLPGLVGFFMISLHTDVLICLSPALDDNGNLTSPLGLQMAEFPLTPMFSKILLTSGKYFIAELSFLP